MPYRSLPARPNLEQLKNQAKDLLKAYRAGQPSARMRFRESLPRVFGAPDDDPAGPSLSLRDAQHVVAVEYGFSNWSLMHAHIQEREDIGMLEMTVERVAVNPTSQQRVVVLKSREVSMYLPIWVGPARRRLDHVQASGRRASSPDDPRPDGLDDQGPRREGEAGRSERHAG